MGKRKKRPPPPIRVKPPNDLHPGLMQEKLEHAKELAAQYPSAAPKAKKKKKGPAQQQSKKKKKKGQSPAPKPRYVTPPFEVPRVDLQKLAATYFEFMTEMEQIRERRKAADEEGVPPETNRPIRSGYNTGVASGQSRKKGSWRAPN